MSKFNTSTNVTAKKSPIKSTGEKTATALGGVGSVRDARSELVLMAVSFMGGDNLFHESSSDRYNRLLGLIHANPEVFTDEVWAFGLVNWVRNTAYMRTVAAVMAVEIVRARLSHELYGSNREIIDVACSRADEPGEILAYFTSKYGKPIPQPIKNGVADAVKRLYTERGFLRYGASGNKAWTMKDVLRITRPTPKNDLQSDLFNYITNGTLPAVEGDLRKIVARNTLFALPQDERDIETYSDIFRDAEMSWEVISSWLGQMDKAAWEAVIPNMGVMALLRNLRNFDKVGISQGMRNLVKSKIQDPEEIAKARLLPMRFFSAFRNAPSMEWHWPIQVGMDHSLANVPELPGRTLALIDMSGSMFGSRLSDKSDLMLSDAAAIFGAALKVKNNETLSLVQYGTSYERVGAPKGTSVLDVMREFHGMGGTNTARVLADIWDKSGGSYDRVIIVTDEQAGYSGYGQVGDCLPNNVPMYTWNLAGYRAGHADSGLGNNHTMGGFSDSAFSMIPIIESLGNAKWPWENNNE